MFALTRFEAFVAKSRERAICLSVALIEVNACKYSARLAAGASQGSRLCPYAFHQFSLPSAACCSALRIVITRLDTRVASVVICSSVKLTLTDSFIFCRSCSR